LHNRFHGILSLLLITLAIIIGLIAILKSSLSIGLLYVAIILISCPVIVYSYCSKCDCRIDACGHVVIGKLTRLLPERQNSEYTALDYLGVLISFLFLFGFPLFWLWKNSLLLLLFITLSLLAYADILLFVCKGCQNHKCPVCIKRNG